MYDPSSIHNTLPSPEESQKPLRVKIAGFCPNCDKPINRDIPYLLGCSCRGNIINNMWYPASVTPKVLVRMLAKANRNRKRTNKKKGKQPKKPKRKQRS